MTTIRPATPADAPAIARIHVETWRHAYRGIIPAAHLDALSIERRTTGWEQNLRKTPGATLVAESAGAVVGWASFGPGRDEGANEQAELYAIYLDPAHQRTGFGRALMAAAERALAAQLPAARRISLWVLERNAPARRFYENLGYIAGPLTKTELIGGEPFVELRYEKIR